MPPHNGHRYLIDFARSFCSDLTVFVCTLRSEPIPGELRFAWMQELFPSVAAVHITEEIPEAARSQSGAHEIWASSIRRHMSADPRYVFASEEYGVGLAAALGARFVPVDPRRTLFPVSAGMIRSDPLSHWEYLPGPVRPYFACRISVAESVGTTGATVHTGAAAELADRFDTVHVTDYRAYRAELAFKEPTISQADDLIAAQVAAQDALLTQANRVIFLETDILRTLVETGDEEIATRLAAGDYDAVLERTRPDAVIALGPLSPAYRREIERRGWALHEIPDDHPNPVDAAEEMARTLLSRHWKSAL